MDKNEFYFSNQTKANSQELEKMATLLFAHVCTAMKLTNRCMLSCTIVDDQAIHQINKQYRHIDAPTDVISFAYDDDKTEKSDEFDDLGEIVISIDTAVRQAAFYSHPAEREVAFLFIHGCLHLLGYDHTKSEADAEKMFALQNDILNSFKYNYQEV